MITNYKELIGHYIVRNIKFNKGQPIIDQVPTAFVEIPPMVHVFERYKIFQYCDVDYTVEKIDTFRYNTTKLVEQPNYYDIDSYCTVLDSVPVQFEPLHVNDYQIYLTEEDLAGYAKDMTSEQELLQQAAFEKLQEYLAVDFRYQELKRLPLQEAIAELMANDKNGTWYECESVEQLKDALMVSWKAADDKEPRNFYSDILKRL
jgi:hypothetical protein